MPPDIRPGAPADAPTCAEVTALALDDLNRRVGRPTKPRDPEWMAETTRLLLHGARLAPNGFHVAEEDGRVVAFASAWPRDGHWWLAFLFARPETQGAGLGTALLERAMAPGAGMNAFTHASADPRAQMLYLRQGMMPWASAVHVSVPVPHAPPTVDGLRLAPLRSGSMAFERERFGYARGPDHRYFMEGGARGYQVERADDSRAGFLYVLKDGRVGPLAVEAEADVAPALDLALAAAREAGHAKVSLAVPNANAEALRWGVARKGSLEGTNLIMSRETLADLGRVVFGNPGLL